MADAEPTLKDFFTLAPSGDDTVGERQPGLPLGDPVSLALADAKLAPSAVVDAVTASLGAFLDIPFSTLIVGAWVRTRLLEQYCERSMRAPEETFVVSLAQHVVRSKYAPSIELLVNEKAIDSLQFGIEVTLALEGLVLRIRNGRIMELRSGKCEASGTITCAGHPMAERKSRAVALPGVVSLGQGIEIGAPAQDTAARVSASGPCDVARSADGSPSSSG